MIMLNKKCLSRPQKAVAKAANKTEKKAADADDHKLYWEQYKRDQYLKGLLKEVDVPHYLREYLEDLWEANPNRNWKQIRDLLTAPEATKLAAAFEGCGRWDGYWSHQGMLDDPSVPPPIPKKYLGHNAYFKYAYTVGECWGSLDA